MSKIDLYKGDFVLSEYKRRFKKSRTKRYKKLGILKVSFFDLEIDTNLNYRHKGLLCYMKFLKTSLSLDETQYEVREIIEIQ